MAQDNMRLLAGLAALSAFVYLVVLPLYLRQTRYSFYYHPTLDEISLEEKKRTAETIKYIEAYQEFTIRTSQTHPSLLPNTQDVDLDHLTKAQEKKLKELAIPVMTDAASYDSDSTDREFLLDGDIFNNFGINPELKENELFFQPPKTICITMPVAYRETSYLLPAAASVLRSMDLNSRFYIYNSMGKFISTDDNEQSTEGIWKDLEFLRKLGVYIHDAKPTEHICAATGKGSIEGVLDRKKCSSEYLKQSLDYISAIQLCLNKTLADYIVVLEDDSYSTSNFTRKVRKFVKTIEDQHHEKSFMGKLFITDFWSGWSNEVVDYVLISAGGFIPLIICFIGIRIKNYCIFRAGMRRHFESLPTVASPRKTQHIISKTRHGSRSFSDFGKPLLISFMWLNCVLFLYVIGKQNTPFSKYFYRGIHKVEFGASTIGTLMSRDVAVNATRFLKENAAIMEDGKYIPIDVLLNLYQSSDNIDTFLVLPNLCEHLGVMTSISAKMGIRKTNYLEYYTHFYKRSAWFEE